jgi:Fe2+ transport system protein B
MTDAQDATRSAEEETLKDPEDPSVVVVAQEITGESGREKRSKRWEELFTARVNKLKYFESRVIVIEALDRGATNQELDAIIKERENKDCVEHCFWVRYRDLECAHDQHELMLAKQNNASHEELAAMLDTMESNQVSRAKEKNQDCVLGTFIGFALIVLFFNLLIKT